MTHDTLWRALQRAIAIARDCGIGPDLPLASYTVRWMESVADGQWEGRSAVRSEIDWLSIWKQIEARITSGDEVQLLQLALEDFARRDGKFFPYVGMAMVPQQAEVLIGQYFRVAGLRLEESIARAVLNDYCEAISASTAIVRAVYRVQHFSAEAAFSLTDEIKIRPIGDPDIDAYGRIPTPQQAIMYNADDWLQRDDWICEIEQLVAKNTMDGFNRVGRQIEDIATALNLAVVEQRARFSLLGKSEKSDFLKMGIRSGGTVTASARRGGGVVLNGEAIERFTQTFARVAKIAIDDRLSPLRLPLRRMRMSSARTNDEDHIVDCVIALENLLASDTPQMESTFRFRLRGAALLPGTYGDVVARIKRMSQLYDIRSKTVHGAKRAHGHPANNMRDTELRHLADEAESVLRAVVLWYLDYVETPGKLRRALEDLDIAMVTGGSEWATKRHGS